MQLIRTDDLTLAGDALAARHGGRVGLAAVLAGLDRRLRRTLAPCLSGHRAWTWDRADRGDRRWWPQGISPAPDGRYVAVTWYATDGGSRVSLLDVRRRRYQHVELVRPTAAGHEPLRVHAGGLAWDGPLLHVAATRAGLWVCHTDDVVRLGHGFVLAPRFRLAPRQPVGEEPFRFSFVSTDCESPAPRLVTGEYGNRQQTRRLARLPAPSPTEGSCDLVDLGVPRAQGVAIADGRYHVTTSHGPWVPGSLWSGHDGALRERRWALPMGPEDLAYDRTTGRLWTLTEHPHRRWIVSLRPTPASR